MRLGRAGDELGEFEKELEEEKEEKGEDDGRVEGEEERSVNGLLSREEFADYCQFKNVKMLSHYHHPPPSLPSPPPPSLSPLSPSLSPLSSSVKRRQRS